MDSGTIEAVATDGTYTYVGGSFTNLAGIGANYLARWNGSTWSAIPALGPSDGVNNEVLALLLFGGELYVGGKFTNGVAYEKGFVRVSNPSTASPTWTRYYTGLTSTIYTIAVDPNNPNSILLGGNVPSGFSGISGTRHAARFVTSAGTFEAINGSSGLPSSVAFYTVRAIATVGARYYVGLEASSRLDSTGILFQSANGLSNTQWTATPWMTGIQSSKENSNGIYAGVYSLLADGTDLIVGGNYYGGNSSLGYLMRFDGTNWTQLISQLDVLGSGLNCAASQSFSNICVQSLAKTNGAYFAAGDFGVTGIRDSAGYANVQLPVVGAAGTLEVDSGTLMIAGNFTSTNAGSNVSRLARFTTSTSSTADALGVTGSTLSPAWDPAVTSYTTETTSTSFALSAIALNSGARIQYSTDVGATWAMLPSSGITNSIAVGMNATQDVSVRVRSSDASSTTTYTIAVTRTASANADLTSIAVSSGSLSPVFSASTTSYSTSVTNGTTSLFVTPTAAHSGASITVNGVTVASGFPSAAISLNVGLNNITIAVEAEDGTTLKTYSVVVTRAPSSNADLSSLALGSGALAPTFSGSTTGYTSSVGHSTATVSVTATTAVDTASLTIAGSSVGSGLASEQIPLSVGDNSISVVVTAQDAATSKTYTITVTREAAPVVTPDPAPSTSPSTSAGTSGGASSSPDGGGTTAPQKSAQSAPAIASKLKVKKKLAISGKTSQGVAMSVKASGACKASGTMVTAGKKPGKCTLTLSAPATEAYLEFGSSVTIKIVK